VLNSKKEKNNTYKKKFRVRLHAFSKIKRKVSYIICHSTYHTIFYDASTDTGNGKGQRHWSSMHLCGPNEHKYYILLISHLILFVRMEYNLKCYLELVITG